jgi:hypothetical protein
VSGTCNDAELLTFGEFKTFAVFDELDTFDDFESIVFDDSPTSDDSDAFNASAESDTCDVSEMLDEELTATSNESDTCCTTIDTIRVRLTTTEAA